MAPRPRPASVATETDRSSALTAAEVQRLHALADLFEPDGFGSVVAPYAVVVQVAEVAGGPPADFTGPGGTPMPLELWSCVLAKVDTRGPIGDVLVAGVETYRREAPRYWRNRHPPERTGPAPTG